VASVVWTAEALDDLDSICSSIRREVPAASARFARAVFEAADRLILFPLSGGVVPERRRPELRELIVGSYRIFYRFENDVVSILRIRHGARRFDPGTIP
jgi:toxin ParE1/3/4